MIVGDDLATMTDAELLAAIRAGDVAAAASRVPTDANYFWRDDVMRDEAKRRNLL